MNNPTQGIPPKLAADYIHAVIDANRRFYSEHIVDRLSKTTSLRASENWEQENSLLLPAQFLLRSSQFSNQRGIGMRYRLMSLWPINKKNSPTTHVEETGFRQVVENPKKPFTWMVQVGGMWYFQAIYPDIAVTDSCVSCHNNHPDSPKKDFKLGDVMGGITINLPLGRGGNKSELKKRLLAPEVVADYIHSVLESDRTVYSKYIVDRLQSSKTAYSSEFWKVENSLPLPAQFLLNASQLVEKKGLGLDFRLISLWPINPRNGTANEFERMGLESVSIHPIRPFIGSKTLGRDKYFQAIYPDFAIAQSCAFCHNNHPQSPKNNFQMNEVMGGIVVTIKTN